MDLFGGTLKPEWEEHWWGMPEFSHENLAPHRQLIVSFANEDEVQQFAEIVGQKITGRTQSVWFSLQEIGVYATKSYE